MHQSGRPTKLTYIAAAKSARALQLSLTTRARQLPLLAQREGSVIACCLSKKRERPEEKVPLLLLWTHVAGSRYVPGGLVPRSAGYLNAPAGMGRP